MHDIDYIFTCINKRQQTTQNFMSQLRTNLIAYRNNLLIKIYEFLFKIIYFGSPLGICGYSPKLESKPISWTQKTWGKLPPPPYCQFYASSNPCPSSNRWLVHQALHLNDHYDPLSNLFYLSKFFMSIKHSFIK
jgi:hypothetical protein